jgi:hypothetical protein
MRTELRCAAAAGRAARGRERPLPASIKTRITSTTTVPLRSPPVQNFFCRRQQMPLSRRGAAAVTMKEAQAPVYARWSEPQSSASREAAPAASTALCTSARGCLPMDRRGVRQLARRGASGCLWRTPLRAAAGGAAARQEHALLVRWPHARAPVCVVCGSREPQESVP